jgi:hypothetical protein
MEVSGQLQAPASLPRGKSPRHPLVRRLGRPQGRSGQGGEENTRHCPCRESNLGRPSRNLVTMLTELLHSSLQELGRIERNPTAEVWSKSKQALASHGQTYLVFIRGQFAKFVDSPYYSEPELCGSAVTVSFSKYLPWQAMHFLQR